LSYYYDKIIGLDSTYEWKHVMIVFFSLACLIYGFYFKGREVWGKHRFSSCLHEDHVMEKIKNANTDFDSVCLVWLLKSSICNKLPWIHPKWINLLWYSSVLPFLKGTSFSEIILPSFLLYYRARKVWGVWPSAPKKKKKALQ
jgi:hypothetical protein